MQKQSFGDWLKRKRKSLDLTQAQLGKEVSCSAAAIRKIEAEERRPSIQIAERLSQIFRIPSTEQSSFKRFARGDWRSTPSSRDEEAPWRVCAPITSVQQECLKKPCPCIRVQEIRSAHRSRWKRWDWLPLR